MTEEVHGGDAPTSEAFASFVLVPILVPVLVPILNMISFGSICFFFFFHLKNETNTPFTGRL